MIPWSGQASATSGSVVVVVAGDISCAPSDPNFNGTDAYACQESATANLVKSISPNYLLPGGDTQYLPSATYREGLQPAPSDFAGGYGASWGQLQNPASPLYVAGLVVRPTPGDHEYGDALETDRGTSLSTASNYYSYFGVTGLNDLPNGVTQASNDFYSFDVPVGTTTWHVISLDSECAALPGPGGNTPSGSSAGCAAGSPEETFLRNDLSSHQGDCTIIHWHEPLNSTYFGYNPDYQVFWNDAVKYNVTLIVNGHDHDYEHWYPMNANQIRTATGVTQIIAGTGGNSLAAGSHSNPNIFYNDSNDFGVLQLNLNPTGADYAFKTVKGTTPDSGTLSCQELSATTVTSISPTSGSSLGGNTVTITGTNLASASAVSFGATNGTIIADSATSITVTAPSGTGTVDVTVTTPAGTSATSPYDTYTYASASPPPPSSTTSTTSTTTSTTSTTTSTTVHQGGLSSAPTAIRVTARGTRTILTWAAPANDGGSAITGYWVGEALNTKATGGRFLDAKPLPGAKRTFVLNNLPTNFRGYFFVSAINANGVGARGWKRFNNGRVPLAPTHLTVTPRGTSAVVTWAAPANNGGFAVTGYQIREVTTISALRTGGLVLNRLPLSAKARSFTIARLNARFNGYFVVIALNARGPGSRAWRHFVMSQTRAT